MAVSIAAWLVITLAAPWALGDNKNLFLKNFVNHEMLSFLGVVVTITLASSASLHIELNKLEESAGSRIFLKTRRRIHLSAYALIWALVVAVCLVTVKPMLGDTDTATSFANGAAMIIILFNILVLADITKTTFSLEPNFKD
jgi:hypothetical protein